MSETHGIKPDWMDTSVSPGVDFNQYCNGAWLARTAIPAEHPRWGAFEMLRDKTTEQLRTVLDGLVKRNKRTPVRFRYGRLKPRSIERSLANLYSLASNEERLEAESVSSLDAWIKNIGRVRNLRQLAAVVAGLHQVGVGGFFSFGPSPDYDDSMQLIAHASQGGLGLPDRDYYLEASYEELRQKYLAHVQRMLVLSGVRKSAARRQSKSILDLETDLARLSMNKVDKRDPDKQRNKMTVDEFATVCGAFPIRHYLKVLESPAFETLNVRHLDFFKGLGVLLAGTPLWILKSYLRWRLIRRFADYLSADVVAESFDFYGKTMMGQKEQQPRWKRAVGMVSSLLPDMLGQVYVAKYFPPRAKERMVELVANVAESLGESIRQADWMSDATRANALVKLSAFKAKIGYPDKWEDYGGLCIDHGQPLALVVMRISRWGHRKDLLKIGTAVDRGEWFMSAQTVNAYYSPQMNDIGFPAGILQPPFFDFEADDAANYGAIAAVIGHEKTHGYDDKGSKFDAQGNLKNWWTDDDRAKFMERIGRIITQYGGFKSQTGKPLNGKLVAGEAASDLGGLVIAYRALQKVLDKTGRRTIGGFTDEQRFFIAFGQLWASKSTPEYEDRLVTDNPHPPARYRANGTVAHMREFRAAFNLPDDAPIMLSDDKRCQLW